MLKTLFGRRANKKKEAAAQLISVKELSEDAGKTGSGSEEHDPDTIIQDPGDKRLSINGLSSFRAPDADDEGLLTSTDPLATMAIPSNGTDQQQDGFGDLTAFIESIVADMDINTDENASEESSSEEMKSFGKKVQGKKARKKAVSEPNVARYNGDDETRYNGGSETRDSPKSAAMNATAHASTPPLPQQTPQILGQTLNRATSLNETAADYHFDVRPRKKSVSFNDVVQERPQSLISTDTAPEESNDKDKPKENEATDEKLKVSPEAPNGHHLMPNGTNSYLHNNVPHQQYPAHVPLSEHQPIYSTVKRASPNTLPPKAPNGDARASNGAVPQCPRPFPTSHPMAAREVGVVTPRTLSEDVEEDCVSVGSDADLYSDSDEEAEEEEAQAKPVKVRSHTKTRVTLLLLSWFVMGMFSQTAGTAGGLPYLMSRLNLTYRPYSLSFLARSGGLALGAVGGGVLGSYVPGYLDLVMCLGLGVGAVSMFVTPWSPGLYWLSAASAGDGVARGILSVGGIVYAVRLWGEEKGCLLIHLLHVAYAFGAAILPQVVYPFLVDSNADTIATYLRGMGIDDLLSYNGFELALNGTQTVLLKREVESRKSNLTEIAVPDPELSDQVIVSKILYVVLGLLPLLLAVVFAVLSFYSKIQKCRYNIWQIQLAKDDEKRRLAKIETDRKEEEKGKQLEINGMIHATGETKAAPEEDQAKTEAEVKEEPVVNDKDDKDGENDKDATTEDTSNSKSANGRSVSFDVDEEKEKTKELTAKTPKFNKNKKKTSQQLWFHRGKNLDVPLLMFLYVFFALPLGAETTMSTFILTYATEGKLQMTNLFASFLMSIFWALMAISRLLSLSMSKCISPNAVMVAVLILNLVTTSLLAAYGDQVHTVLWFLTGVCGVTLGPIFPGGLTWANIYLSYNPKTLSLVFCLAAMGAMLFTWVTGFLVDFYGISVLMYVLVSISVLSLVLYLPAMRGLGVRKMFKIKMKRTKDLVLSSSQKTYL